MMKSIVLLCLVSVIAAAEVDFRQRNSGVAGRPIRVPVVEKRGLASNQQKRQVDYDAGSRPASGASSRQQQPGVPLQQPYRQSTSSASFRRPSLEQPAEQNQRASGAPSSFPSAPSSFAAPSSSESFAEGPARSQPQRPVRPANLASSAERPTNRSPEFASGFPAGFTSGLPSFDFQGRMPEPDGKSEGFMDGVMNNFPNLKALGGFDAFPDVAREDDGGIKRPQAPSRPAIRPNNAQKRRSRRAAIITSRNASLKNTKPTRKNRPIVVEDDEAMLEPDLPLETKRTNKLPTDIADIIADSTGAEQRYNPTFHPNSGPYGRPYTTPQITPASPGRSRRPNSQAVGPTGNRQAQRIQFNNQFEFVDDNSLLGSGNFDVLGGGVFHDTTDYRPYINTNAQYYPPSPPAQDTFRPNQQFYPLGQPPSQQLGNFGAQPPIPQQQPPAYNVPSYPTSFFDDDFFSNFRDFADVNQDYRN